jgi:Spy/CpxP family protein refolding chaperone
LVSAQNPDQPQGPKPQQGPPRPPDPFADALFPPDLVMQHQRELGLTDEQKTYMRNEINRTTTRFTELQWQLQDATEALHETMKAGSVNEQLALSQLDKILDGEREIKRAHMELAIRIKNKLTPDQQAKLQAMKKDMGPGRGPGGPDGPGRRPGHGPGGPGGPSGPGGPGGPGPGGPGQRPPEQIPDL